MTNFDFNDANDQRSIDVIPRGTICTLQLTIRAGGVGEGSWLKQSADGRSTGLDCEFVVVDGPHIKRRLWERYVQSGTTAGQEEAVKISRGKLRAIIESARGIKPDDMSEQARKARTVELRDFDGLQFIARIGIEKGKPRTARAKITPTAT